MLVNFEKISALAECEVLIAGGGIAGCAAAIAAARNGAKVILCEQSGVLAGLGTLGLGPMFAPRSADGIYDLSSGIGSEVITEMCRRMNRDNHFGWVSINPEILKKILDEMLDEVGVKLFFEQKIIDIKRNSQRIEEVAVSGIGGIKKIAAQVFVDCTGNAALSEIAGAECMIGGEVNRELMSPTLCVQYSNIDFKKYEACGKNAREYWLELAKSGKAPLPELHFVGIFPAGESVGLGNLGHIYNVDLFDEEDLSNAYIEGRKLAGIYLDFYRKYVPGFENAELSGTAALLGIRESRRVKCDYVMTKEDYFGCCSFEDEIGRFNYPIDIHASTVDPESQKDVERKLRASVLKYGESYGIPFRALVVKNLENLLIAGRITSSDRSIQSSLRVMPGCFITGQAAGIGAALAVTKRMNLHHLDIQEFKLRLKKLIG